MHAEGLQAKTDEVGLLMFRSISDVIRLTACVPIDESCALSICISPMQNCCTQGLSYMPPSPAPRCTNHVRIHVLVPNRADAGQRWPPQGPDLDPYDQVKD